MWQIIAKYYICLIFLYPQLRGYLCLSGRSLESISLSLLVVVLSQTLLFIPNV